MKCCIILSTVLLLHAVGSSVAKTSSDVTNSTELDGNSALKTSDKMTYPKKVISLKKRPTKSPRITSSTTMSSAVSTTTEKSSETEKSTNNLKSKVDVLEDSFKNLPADDLEFIKELDKQFQLHGGKIKIKVERDNSTNKTNKRTIEGDLGYGYASNGYHYDPPKFMFYPYSQKDIPPTESSYYENYDSKASVSSVTIEPSYSYELKPQTTYETGKVEQPQIDLPHEHGHLQPVSDVTSSEEHASVEPVHEEPVIVLRIPGPAKYASHLQTLLQQYLEIRATQYLRLLEEAEQRKQHGVSSVQDVHDTEQLIETHPETVSQYEPSAHYQQQPQTEYQTQHVPEDEHNYNYNYNQEVSYAHQLAPTPAPVNYAPIDDVYQSYKGRHQQLHQHQQQQQQVKYQQPAHEQYYTPQHHPHQLHHQHHQQQQYQEVPQYYYMQHSQPQADLPGYAPQVYLIAMTPQAAYGEPVAVTGQQQQQQHQHQHQVQTQPIYVPDEEHGHETNLPITENSPRDTHTKVIFTPHHEQGGADYTHNRYSLPSIRPYERHAPSVSYQQQNYHAQSLQHSQQAVEASEQHALDYQQKQQLHPPQHDNSEGAAAHVQASEQRPFNYHAHGHALRKPAAGHSKRAAAASHGESDLHLEKIREYVRDKLGAKMGSAIEY